MFLALRTSILNDFRKNEALGETLKPKFTLFNTIKVEILLSVLQFALHIDFFFGENLQKYWKKIILTFR